MTVKQAQILIDQFKSLYQSLNYETCQSGIIEQVYHPEMVFKDSFHEISGVVAFREYCESLYENLKYCEFEFHKEWVRKNDAMLTWTMRYAHPKLNRGKEILVEGASQLQFESQVLVHQDYFDGGNLLYEHVPVLGGVISILKKRLNS